MTREGQGAEDHVAQRFAEFVELLQQGIAVDLSQIQESDPQIRAQLEEALQLAKDIANPLSRRVPEIPGFQLLRPLGQGSSSTVWLAMQQSLSREVALKVVHLDSLPTPSARERCLREARTLARIRDSRVVAVHDVIEHGQWLAIAMDHVPGPNLRSVLRAMQSQLDTNPATTAAMLLGVDKRVFGASWPQWVARQGVRLARALAGLHANGLVHRDVKPENVLLTPEGETVLADLGLARARGDLASVGLSGTPFYAAPEQWRSHATPDGRADVYSLGVLLYELLALALPVERHPKLSAPPQPLPQLRSRAKDVGRDLATVIHKAIEIEPDRRYSDANAFADDLDRVLHLLPVLASPPSAWWRAIRFCQRHRKGAIAATAGVALAAAAFVPLIDHLQQQLRAPQIASMSAAVARARVLDVIASRAEDARDTADEPQFDAAASLRLAVAHYDESLNAREDALLRQEREVASLAATMLESRSGEFPVQPETEFGQAISANSRFRSLVSAGAKRWLYGIGLLSPSVALPTAQEELTALGLLACLLGDLRACEDCWERLDPMTAVPPLLDAGRGLLFVADARPDRALACLLRASAEFPDDGRVARKLADAAVQVGDRELATRALHRVTQLSAEKELSLDAQRIQADLDWLAGNPQAAAATYERLAETDPHAAIPRARLAALQLARGDGIGAVNALRTLVAQHPEQAWIRLELARAAIAADMLGDYLSQARHVVRESTSGSPLPHGKAQCFAAILALSGQGDRVAKGTLRTQQQSALGIATDSVALALADPKKRARLAAILERLTSFDRAPYPQIGGREQPLLEYVSVATRATLAAPDVLLHVSPTLGAPAIALASMLRLASGQELRHAVAIAWLTVERCMALDSERCRALPPLDLKGADATALVLHTKNGYRTAILTRSALDQPSQGQLRAVTPFGISSPARLELRVLANESGELGDPIELSRSSSMLRSIGLAHEDIDGDGDDDIIVVSCNLGSTRGRVMAISSASGRELWSQQFGGPRKTLPWSIATTADLDGDGLRDLALGLPNVSHPLSPSDNLAALSARTGTQIWAQQGPSVRWFGFAVAQTGELLAIGSPHRHSAQGLVELRDPTAGALAPRMQSIQPQDATSGFGRVLAPLPDLDQDGIADLAVADAAPTPSLHAITHVWAISCRTTKTLWKASSERAGDGFGSTIQAGPDYDGDGIHDVWIGAPCGDLAKSGSITLHSGATGKVITRILGSAPGAQLGSCILDDAANRWPAFALGQVPGNQIRRFLLTHSAAR